MQKKEDKLLKIFLIYILLQPFLDILSYLSIRDIIPFGISTYLKPIFVFTLGAYLLFTKCNNKKSWLIYISLFAILTVGHSYLLYKLLIDTSVILHELRFLINIAYMIALFIITDAIFKDYPDKEELLRKLKKTVLTTFCLYFGLLLVSILSGTASKTYEYADLNKLGYKGWFDSGQILGHAFSIIFPSLIYIILSPKRKWYYRIIIMILFIVGVSLIGTKVPYFITLIVCILYLLVSVFVKIFNKDHKSNYFNLALISIIIIAMLTTYKYTPVKYNTDINKNNAQTSINDYNLGNESGSNSILSIEELKEMYPNRDINRLIEYQEWNKESSEYLQTLFKENKLHPSNMRFKQIYYANKKYKLSSIEYKIFGLGFLNQDTSLALESDFFMALYSFGILGLILFLIIPLKEFIKSTIFILKHLKLIDLETYMLYMGLGVFFCISIYAGYTYIYTNFSIFLVILTSMLKIKRYLLKKSLLKENKVSFLLLHLGYGGIETATINTANALSDKYEVELVSFYNLTKNQVNRLNNNIKVKYLYQGEPNKEAFLESLKNHKLLKTIKEGLKAVSILIKKKVLVIHEIINNNSKFLVSTRYEFSILLSKYGFKETTKIAAEHHYHNNSKKYINILKYKYNNIDYLLALTKTLEEDYHRFLKHNHHTKIVLMPNMLEHIPTKKSTLEKKEIITMSRLDYGKKNDDIIKAFAKTNYHNWHLSILGDGSEYKNLSSLIKELHLENNVSLEGYIPKEKLEKYLLNSSIFLMASLTEGLPMVLLEAMSYGLPCIAYETASGVNDIIDNGKNGYVIKERNEELYVKKLQSLMDDATLRKKMSKEALEKVKCFSKENIVKKWYNILK